MKKVAVVLTIVVLSASIASMVLAVEPNMGPLIGTIKSVDATAGTVVFSPEGSNRDVTLKADKSVDLSKVKAGEKVHITINKDTLKQVKAAPAAAP
jgi:hypothetical protein